MIGAAWLRLGLIVLGWTVSGCLEYSETDDLNQRSNSSRSQNSTNQHDTNDPHKKGEDQGNSQDATGNEKDPPEVIKIEPEPTDTSLQSELFQITETGRISGYAVLTDDTETTLEVNFYIDGDNTSGSLVATVRADSLGFDNDHDGNHAFAVTLSPDLIDNRPHTLHAYATIDGEEVTLSGSPQQYTAYGKTTTGREFYDSEVLPTLTANCGGCHTIDYDIHWSSLISPSPSQGGTRTNNEMINKPAAQVPHGGMNNYRCTSLDDGVCGILQEWWDVEFEAL